MRLIIELTKSWQGKFKAMSPMSLLIFLILSIGLVYASSDSFTDFSDYLMENESIDDFSTANYTYEGIDYRIVFDPEDVPILIFELDETAASMLIVDNETIEDILTDYYRSLFYPSLDELDQLRADLDTFNASRNADTYYETYQKTYKEPESFCDRILYLENSDCAPDNEFGCKQLGSMICALYGEGCDPYGLGDAAFEYVTLKFDFDSAIETAADTLDNIEVGNISDNLEQLKEDIEAVREAADDYADCKVRLPVGGSSECGDCLGVCPAFTFDYDTLDSMEELIDNLIEKVVPYSEMNVNILNAMEETAQRERYLITQELQPIYLQRFTAINKKYPNELDDAEEILTKIINSDLSYYYTNAKSLKETLNNDISNYNVDNVTSQYLNQYESYLQSIRQTLNQENLTASYDDFELQRDKTISLLIKTKWSIDRTNSQQVEDLNELGSLYNQYESEYSPPMTDSQYAQLSDKYSNLSIELNTLLQSAAQGGSSIEKMIYGFSDSTNEFVSGILGFDESTARAYKVIIPVLVLLLVDIVLIVLAVFMFMYYTKTKRRFFIKRSVLLSWTLLLILFVIVISVGSIGVYNVMRKTGEETPFSIFESEILDTDNINILVDYRGAPVSDAASMEECYILLKDSFISRNRTVNEYVITGSTCSGPGGTYTPDECDLMAREGAMINLYYSSTDSGYDFRIVPDIVGEFYGSKDIFDNCEIGYVFKHSG